MNIKKMLIAYKDSNSFNSLADSTKALYLRGLDALLDHMGPKAFIEDMTTHEVDRFYSKLRRTYDDNGVRRMLKGPRAAYRYLVKMRDIAFNPFSIYSANPQYKERQVVISKKDLENIFETAKGLKGTERSYLYGFLKYLYITAQRPQDVLNMSWENLKYSEEHEAHYFEIETTKTDAIVYTWYTEELVELENYVTDRTSNSLFFKSNSRLQIGTARRDFNYLLTLCELDGKYQLRDFRRTRATRLLDEGYTDIQVMSITGHTNLAVFKKVYAVTSKDTSSFMLNRGKRGEEIELYMTGSNGRSTYDV